MYNPAKVVNTNENSSNKSSFLTVSKAANILKISASSLRRLETEGTIKSFRLENSYRVFNELDVYRVKDLLDKQKQQKHELKTIRKQNILKEKSANQNFYGPNILVIEESSNTKNENFSQDINLGNTESNENSFTTQTKKDLGFINLSKLRQNFSNIILKPTVVFALALLTVNALRANLPSKYITNNGSKNGASTLEKIIPTNQITSLSSTNLDVLGLKDRVQDFVFYVNVPTNFRRSTTIDETLNVTGTSTLAGGTVTSSVTFQGEGSINNLQTIDTTSKTTLENILELTGDVTGTLSNNVISNGAITEEKLAEEISYSGDFNFDGTWAIGGTEVTVTADVLNTLEGLSATVDELNYLEGSTVTDGGVVFGNGTNFTQDSANLFWDDANNRLGIATNTPTTTLDVNGTLRVTGTTTLNTVSYTWPGADGTNGQVLSTNGTGSLSWVSAGGGGTIDGTGTSSYIPLWQDSNTLTDSAFYQSGSNVGIGTTAPTSLLHIAGTLSATGTVAFSGLGTGTDNTVVILNGSNQLTTDEIDSRVWGVTLIDSSTGATNYVGRFSDSDSLTIGTLYDTGTSVGVGTTAPGYTLDVNGDIHIAAGSDLYIGTIGLNDTGTNATNPGAHLVGVFDEFTNSNGTTVQQALNDLDAAIGAGASKWTQGTGLIYLTSTTDEVIIGGTTSLSSKFAIDGDADEVQLLVQGNSTQTSNLAVFEQSTGNDVLAFNNNGDLLAGFTDLSTGSTTNGTGTSTNTMVLNDATNFNVGNYIRLSNANCFSSLSTCYSKIRQKTGNTLTLFNNLTWANGASVAEFHIPEVGATNTAETLANRFGQGFFISGVVTGNGSTYYSDGAIFTSDVTSADSQDLTISTGTTTTSGDSGDITIDTGLAAGTEGVINIGITSASGIVIGHSGITTEIQGNLVLNDESFVDLTGNGLTISANALTIDLTTATDGLSSTISNGSGLEVLASGLTLLQGCDNGQLLKWNESNDSWECSNDTGATSAIINVESNDVAVGSNVDTLDFTSDFTLAASPANEVNISIADDILNFTEFSDTLVFDADTSFNLYNGSTAVNSRFYNSNSGSEILYLDGNNGRIGIGTTAPSQELEVVGDIAIRDDSFIGFTSSTARIDFDDQTTDEINILSANLGVGTTTPASLLSVGATNQFRVDSSGNVTRINNVAYSWPGSQAAADNYVLTNDSNGNLTWESVASLGGVDGTGTANYIPLWSDTDTLTSSVVYQTGGNVGIGTTSPAALLHIAGTARATTFSDGTATLSAGTLDLGTNTIYDGNLTGNWALNDGNLSGVNSITADNTITFSGLASSSTEDTLVVLNASNQLEQRELSDILTDNNLIDGSGITNYVARFSDGNTLTTGIVYDTGTALGVGTTAPSALLHVAGTARATTFSDGTATLSSGTLDLGTNTITDGTLTGNWAFSDGNLTGVNSITADNTITFTGLGTGTDNTVVILNSSNQLTTDEIDARVWGTSLVDSLATTNYLPYMSDADSLSNSSIYYTGGNLGIGTTAPSTTLDVVGNITASGDINGLDLNESADGFNIVGGSSSARTLTVTGSNITLTGGGNTLTLTGNATLNQNLQTSDSPSFAGLSLTALSGGSTDTILILSGGNAVQTRAVDTRVWGSTLVDAAGTANYVSRFSDANTLTIGSIYDTGTNVGIGTTAPSSLLHVAGTATATTFTDGTATLSAGTLDLGTNTIYDGNLTGNWTLNDGNLSGVNTLTADNTVTFSGLGTGTDNTVVILNGSNQLTTDEIDSRVWGTSLVDSSATTNYLPYMSDADSLSNSSIYYTGGNFGIGTTAPSGTLHIAGSNQTALRLDAYGSSAGNTSELRFQELTANGSEYTGFKAPDTLTSSLLYTLPSTTGASDYVLTWQSGNTLEWKSVTGAGGGDGDITAVGSMTDGDVFSDSTADDDWLGLGASAGRLEFDDQTTDEINLLGANVGIGNTTPASLLSVGATNQFQVDSNGDIVKINNIAYAWPDAQAGADNYVLTNDGNGTLTWESVTGAGGLDGSGTTNYLPLWNDSNTLASSGIYQTGGNIGIGTTAPTSLLHVNGVARVSSLNVAGVTAMDYTSGVFRIGAISDNYPVSIWTNSADRIRIDTSGNVGIGTTAPSSILTVAGNITPSTDDTHDLGTTALQWNDLFLGGILDLGTNTITDGTLTGNWAFSDGNLTGVNAITADNLITFSGLASSSTEDTLVVLNASNQLEQRELSDIFTDNNLVDGTGTTNYLPIWSDGNTLSSSVVYQTGGNVGIGTTAPSSLLHVAGTARATTFSDGTATLTAGTLDLGTNTIYDGNLTGNWALNDGNLTGVNTLTADNTITFTGLGTGTDNTVVILNSSNQLTTDEIDARVWGTTLLDSSTGAVNYVARFSDADTLAIGSIYDTGTNVGIGTTAPSQELEVVGDIAIRDDSFIGLSSSAARIDFDDLGTDEINLLSANVGIGSTTPASLLSVGATNQFQVDSSGDIVKINNVAYAWPDSQAAADNYVLTNDGNGNLLWEAVSGAGAIDGAGIANYLPIWSDTNTLSSSAVYQTGGNVGIGTTAPSSLLHVAGTARATTFSDGTATLSAGTLDLGTNTILDGNFNGNWAFNSGNLSGIGTISAATDETINGIDINAGAVSDVTTLSATSTITFSGLGTGTDNTVVILNGSNQLTTDEINAKVWQDSASLVDATSGIANYVARFSDSDTITTGTLYDTGTAVGIGTTAPSTALQVVGTITGTTLTDGTASLNSGTLDLGTNTIYDGNLTGNWALNDGNLTGVNSITADNTITFSGLASSSTEDTLVVLNASNQLEQRELSDIFSDNGLIDGTGTTNYLPIWSDGNTLSSSAVYQTGGNVGIGTTAPSSLLHVAGTARATTFSDGTATLSAGTLDLGTNTILDGNFNGNWAFNSGNLSGIGTISAATDETINGIDINAGAVSDITTLAATSTVTFSGLGTGTDNTVVILNGSNQLTTDEINAKVWQDSASLVDATSGIANYVARFSDSDTITTGVLYDTGTAVGIGTTAPSTALHVAGTATATTFTDGTATLSAGTLDLGTNTIYDGNLTGNWALNEGNLTGVNSITADNTITFSGLASSSTEDTLVVLNASNQLEQRELSDIFSDNGLIDGSGTTNYLPIWSDGNTLSSSVVYQTGGNVGIGTTAPTTLLHIAGTVRAITFSDGIASLNAGTLDLGTNTILDGNFNGNWAFNSGNLSGIGTISAATDETINGIDINAGAVSDITTLAATSTVTFSGLGTGTDNTVIILNGSNQLTTDEIDSRVWGTSLVDASSGIANYVARFSDADTVTTGTIYDTGTAVGIGTTAPSSILQVAGTLTATTFNDGTATLSTGTLDLGTNTIYDGNLTGNWSLNDGNLTGVNSITADNTITFSGLGTGTDNTVVILNSSNQLTTDEIDARVWGTSLVDSSATTNYIPYMSDSDSLANSGLYYTGGNFGIGTTAPSQELEVAGDIAIRDDSFIGLTSSTARIDFDDQGTDEINLLSANVGIGSTTPASLLSVGASNQFQVNSSGDLIRLNNIAYEWPDAQAVTDNYVLVNDGTGVLTWEDISGVGGLDGSGTANYIPLWSDSNTLTVSGLYQTGGNVGIGTTAPSSLLHVAGTTRATTFTDGTTTLSAGTLDLGTNTIYDGNLTGNWALNDGNLTGVNSITADNTITLTGLGTGTDNTVVILNSSNQLTTDEIDARVWGTTLTDASSGIANYVARFSDADTVTTGVLYDTGSLVGIGTTAPGVLLDVAGGNIRTNQQLVSTIATGTSPLSIASTTLVSNLNADLLDGLSSADFLRSNADDSFEAASTLTIAGTIDITGAIEIDNVEITSTAAELNLLDGSTAVTGGLVFGNGTYITQDSGNLFWNDSTNRLGIGTTAPSTALHVVGTTTATTFTDGTASLSAGTLDLGTNTIYDGNLTGNWALNDGNLTGVNSITADNTITFTGLGTGTDNTVVILNASNQLTTDEIDARVWGTTLTDTSSGIANYVARFSDADTVTTGTIYDTGTAVGIGTTAPSSLLQVAGTLTATTFVAGSGLSITDSAILETGDIVLQADSDIDDYLYLSTDSNAAQIYWEGYSGTNDPGLRVNPATSELEYRDEDSASWVAFDSIGGASTTFDDVYAYSLTAVDLTMEIDNAAGLTFNMTTTGDFILQDNGNSLVNFGDDSAIVFSPSNASAAGGYIQIDADTVNSTATGGVLDLNLDTVSDGFEGINIDLNITDDAGADTIMGQYLNIDNDATTADDTVYGLYINGEDSGTNDVDLVADALIYLNQADTDNPIPSGIFFNAAAGGITTAIDASDAQIDNAISIGTNTLAITTGTIGSNAATVVDFAEFDISGSTGAITINDDGDLGSITIDGTALDINSLDFAGAGALNTNDWDISATGDLTGIGAITADGTITATGLGTGTDNTVLILNASNQITTDEIDSRVWGSALVDSTATSNYVPYMTDDNTMANSGLYYTGGNFGIGNTAPSTTLYINGTFTASSSVNTSSYLLSSIASLGYSGTELRVGTGAFWQSQSLYTNGSRRLTIDSTGNVGIGTTAPSTTLDVAGGFLLGNGSATGQINTSDWDISTTGDLTGIGAITANGTYTTSTGTSTAIDLTRSAAGQWMGFSDGTDVWGLYNTAGSPEGVLTANTGALSMDTTNGTLYVKTDDGDATGWTNLATGGATLWSDGGNYIYADNATNVSITDTGFIGIGTTAPVSEFQVAGTTPQIWLGDGGAEDTSLIFDGNAQDFYMALNDVTDDLIFGTGTTIGSNALFTIENGGNIGIGTTAPSASLHILDTTEQLRLGYDASNYASFTIDSTGNLTFADTGTSVATFGATQASFAVPTAFNAAGDVSIAYDIQFTNQTSATILSDGPLEIRSGETFENQNLTLTTYGTGDIIANLGTGSTNPNAFLPGTDDLHDLGSSSYRWDDVYATNGTIQTSDVRLKENIIDLSYGLEEIMQLRPVSYTWIGKAEKGNKLGLIAQEAVNVIPEAVDVPASDDEGFWGLRYSDLVPVLVKGMQEQQAQIESLNSQLQGLNGTEESTGSSVITEANSILSQVTGMFDEIKDFVAALGLSVKTNTEGANYLAVETDLNVLGKTTLGDTFVTGDLSVGLIKINSLENSISTIAQDQTLYLQNYALAGNLDIFNGKIVLNPDGTINAEKVVAGTYSVRENSETIGTSTIVQGTDSITVDTTAVTQTSKIFITATTSTNGNQLYVQAKNTGTNFTVKIDNNAAQDITFDWWIVETEQ